MSTPVCVNGTLSIYFPFGHEHYHNMWFAHCNRCTLIFLPLKLENELKKHAKMLLNIDLSN